MTNQNAKVSNFLSLRGAFSFLSLRGTPPFCHCEEPKATKQSWGLPRFARNDIKGGRGQVPPLQVNVVARFILAS